MSPTDGGDEPALAGLARPALPSSAAELPAMGPAFDETLEAGLVELGLEGGPAASAAARRSYELHARLLREWGSAINLSAIREPEAIARRHVCDSLAAFGLLAARLAPGAALLDLGSGAGYPGLPLAAALPLARVALVDSVAKKARFLRVASDVVAAALAEAGATPPAVEVLAERAEDLAEDAKVRGAWDVVTARAVGSLSEVVELAMPLAREGGSVVAWKREGDRGDLSRELREAGSIIRATGGGRLEVVPAGGALLPGHRLVVIPKLRPTPATYPRPAGRRRRAS